MMYSRSGRKARKEQMRKARKEQKCINAEIERQLRKDRQESRREMKLIVLGQ